MERLTRKDAYGYVHHPWEFNGVNGSYDIFDEDLLAKQIDRLAAYEDTGIDPDELRIIGDIKRFKHEIIFGSKADRLKELSDADNAGRLIVLPCNVGDTVYVIDKGDYTHAFKPYVRSKTVREISWKATSRKDLGWGLILAGGDCGTSARYKLSSIGKTVFLTREEAEAALAQKGGRHEADSV